MCWLSRVRVECGVVFAITLVTFSLGVSLPPSQELQDPQLSFLQRAQCALRTHNETIAQTAGVAGRSLISRVAFPSLSHADWVHSCATSVMHTMLASTTETSDLLRWGSYGAYLSMAAHPMAASWSEGYAAFASTSCVVGLSYGMPLVLKTLATKIVSQWPFFLGCLLILQGLGYKPRFMPPQG
ncbi:hypothetical protein EIL50_00930 [bacterium NHP-B]|nr:hypothetical protein EIL50_00930 [bacterium NHP-B]